MCFALSNHWKNVHYVHNKKGYKVISKADYHYIVKKLESLFIKGQIRTVQGQYSQQNYLNTHANKNFKKVMEFKLFAILFELIMLKVTNHGLTQIIDLQRERYKLREVSTCFR